MPPKRSTHVGPAPAPLVPEPRAAFVGALDRLVPVVEHDFSIHPATFHAIDQRLAVLALYLFRDSCYRDPKHARAALPVLEWAYSRLLQLHDLYPFEAGDLYHLVSMAPSSSSLSDSTRELIVNFVLGEGVDGYALHGVLAADIYGYSLVRSWGATPEMLRVFMDLDLSTLTGAARFVVEGAKCNGGKLLLTDSYFISNDGIDYALPFSSAQVQVMLSELDVGIRKFKPDAELRVTRGHTASTGRLGVDLLLGLPDLSDLADRDEFLKDLLGNLASKNEAEPARWGPELSFVRTDEVVTTGYFANTAVFSIGGWVGNDRVDVNLVVVAKAQMGAAELVWSSPPAWLDSFASILSTAAGQQLRAGGLVPTGNTPSAMAPDEGTIFDLAGVSFQPASARQCGISPCLHISRSGESVSLANYAVSGPVFSSPVGTSNISLVASAGIALVGRRLPPNKRAPLAPKSSPVTASKQATAAAPDSERYFLPLDNEPVPRDPRFVTREFYDPPSPSTQTSAGARPGAKAASGRPTPARSASSLEACASILSPRASSTPSLPRLFTRRATPMASRTVSGLPAPRGPLPASSPALKTSTGVAGGPVATAVGEKGPSSSSKSGSAPVASVNSARSSLELGCVGIKAPDESYVCYLMATIQALSHSFGPRFVPEWSIAQADAKVEPLQHALLIALRNILRQMALAEPGAVVDATAVIQALRAAASTEEKFDAAHEHDVHELLNSAILPALGSCADRMPEQRLEFAGIERELMRCKGCGEPRCPQVVPFWSLTLVLPLERSDSVPLRDLLAEYCASRTLDAVPCDTCKTAGPFAQSRTFVVLPPYLILVLCRFDYNKEDRQTKKYKALVDYPLTFELEGDDSGVVSYELRAVVRHHGERPHSGHYTTVARGIAVDSWFRCDGANVHAVDVNEVLSSRDAYVLFYKTLSSS